MSGEDKVHREARRLIWEMGTPTDVRVVIADLVDGTKVLRAQLAEANARLEAIRVGMSAWHTSHYLHWDREGNAGRTCPACIADNAFRACLRAALASGGKP